MGAKLRSLAYKVKAQDFTYMAPDLELHGNTMRYDSIRYDTFLLISIRYFLYERLHAKVTGAGGLNPQSST